MLPVNTGIPNLPASERGVPWLVSIDGSHDLNCTQYSKLGHPIVLYKGVTIWLLYFQSFS